jgi:hypothetical protein
MTRDLFVGRLVRETPLTEDAARATLAVVAGAGVDPAEAFATVAAPACCGCLRAAPGRERREG